MNSVYVTVPATTANVGPGFDCLGIALQIYNVVTVTKESGGPDDPFVAQAAELFFQRSGKKPFEFQWKVTGDVPRSRGMGSSVTVRLGLLHGLNALAGRPLGGRRLFELCAKLEGHPDNAAPAAFGGFTIARPGALQRFRVKKSLEFALLIPDFEVATSEARRVLPAELPFRHAVVSAGNACAIAAAFASGEYENLRGCFEDGLHQPFREPLVPFLPAVIRAGEEAGALGGWLSCSGSTIACASLGRIKKVARAMLEACGQSGAWVVTTRADNRGVRVSRG